MSTSSSPAKERLKTTGVWYFTDTRSAGEAAEFAQRLESLGYSTLWLPDTLGRDPFAHVAWLASQTETIQFATGIASIFHRHPGPMMQAGATLAEQTGGRFVLGLGVSHAPIVEGLRQLDYSKPLTSMSTYLDAMSTSLYVGPGTEHSAPLVIAALGPKMLALAAEKTDGAHPYWTNPDHTAQAREILGPDKLLCVEQKVCLTTDSQAAYSAAASALAMYAELPNYRNNWKRLGYTEEEISSLAPRFLDGVIGWGDEAAVAKRIQEHYDAGADHVCIQPLAPDGEMATLDWNVLEAMAPINQ